MNKIKTKFFLYLLSTLLTFNNDNLVSGTQETIFIDNFIAKDNLSNKTFKRFSTGLQKIINKGGIIQLKQNQIHNFKGFFSLNKPIKLKSVSNKSNISLENFQLIVNATEFSFCNIDFNQNFPIYNSSYLFKIVNNGSIKFEVILFCFFNSILIYFEKRFN